MLRELSALGMHVSTDNAEVAQACRILFLCTKPDIVVPAVRQLSLQPGTLLISIAAGLSLAAIEAAAPPDTKAVRVMPNTPALVGQSASAFALGARCTEADGQLVHQLLSSFGLALRVAEKDLNGVTGLSGSGPAYVFLFIEALADGGVRAGLTRQVAMQLAIQTVRGSAQLVEETGKHPGQLKDQVARSDTRGHAHTRIHCDVYARSLTRRTLCCSFLPPACAVPAARPSPGFTRWRRAPSERPSSMRWWRRRAARRRWAKRATKRRSRANCSLQRGESSSAHVHKHSSVFQHFC